MTGLCCKSFLFTNSSVFACNTKFNRVFWLGSVDSFTFANRVNEKKYCSIFLRFFIFSFGTFCFLLQKENTFFDHFLMYCVPAAVPKIPVFKPRGLYAAEANGQGAYRITFNLPQKRLEDETKSIQDDTFHIYLYNADTGDWTNRTVPTTTRTVVYSNVQPGNYRVFFQGSQSTTGVMSVASMPNYFTLESGKRL